MSAFDEVRAQLNKAARFGDTSTRVSALTVAVNMLIDLVETHKHSTHPADGDVSGPMKVPAAESNACNCLGHRAACWHCYQGEHDECTADQHGNNAKCSRGAPAATSDPYACNCLGREPGGPNVACWNCWQGEHDKCTSGRYSDTARASTSGTKCAWGASQAKGAADA
jgi:hypothetical protein